MPWVLRLKNKIIFSTIIFILIGLVTIPMLIGTTVCLKSSKANFDIKNLSKSISIYFKKNSNLPSSLYSLISPDYNLNRLPIDPWDSEYSYQVITKNKFMIWSSGSVIHSDTAIVAVYSKTEDGFEQMLLYNF
ncbi:type II secretion system protein GspG [Algibacillus agarilyticus]|uniref:type II secretion system protein GspG n=1 Tax=Algibacillus agarilyticus TaxID=2234133 RepID=UPI000DD0E8AB|nr:type II secretion system protein GspG [Algibacillus agarilyticus]